MAVTAWRCHKCKEITKEVRGDKSTEYTFIKDRPYHKYGCPKFKKKVVIKYGKPP